MKCYIFLKKIKNKNKYEACKIVLKMRNNLTFNKKKNKMKKIQNINQICKSLSKKQKKTTNLFLSNRIIC